MKTIILCGGQGMRLREHTDVRPKPMVEIGGMPILWHIMKTYAFYGFNDFVLCLGYKGDFIKDYFYNYEILTNDFTIELGTKNIEIYPKHEESGWKVTLADTGQDAMTGSRVKKVERFIDDDIFFLTYGDGVIDLDISELLDFHKKHGKLATVTGVFPPSRYGELVIEDDHVLDFQEKTNANKSSINGGYFVFNKSVFDYIRLDDDCVLEREVLPKLSKEGQLKVFQHSGFWQCMDTYRDYVYLQDLWNKEKALWKKW